MKCSECGCPHTTITNHVQWNHIKFFLSERSCDNCGNTWIALEPISRLNDTSYAKHTNPKEREVDRVVFEKINESEDSHPTQTVSKSASELLVILVDEIKDLKITINNTNKKVKELTSIIEKLK